MIEAARHRRGPAAALALLSASMLLQAGAEATFALARAEPNGGASAAMRSAATTLGGIGILLLAVLLAAGQVPPAWRLRWIVGLTLVALGYAVSYAGRWTPGMDAILLLSIVVSVFTVGGIAVVASTPRTVLAAAAGAVLSVARLPLNMRATSAFVEGTAAQDLSSYDLWSTASVASGTVGALLLAAALALAAVAAWNGRPARAA